MSWLFLPAPYSNIKLLFWTSWRGSLVQLSQGEQPPQANSGLHGLNGLHPVQISEPPQTSGSQNRIFCKKYSYFYQRHQRNHNRTRWNHELTWRGQPFHQCSHQTLPIIRDWKRKRPSTSAPSSTRWHHGIVGLPVIHHILLIQWQDLQANPGCPDGEPSVSGGVQPLHGRPWEIHRFSTKRNVQSQRSGKDMWTTLFLDEAQPERPLHCPLIQH